MSDKTLSRLIRQTKTQTDAIRRELSAIDEHLASINQQIAVLENEITQAYNAPSEYSYFIDGFVTATKQKISDKCQERLYYQGLQADCLENLRQVVANQKRFEILQSNYRRHVKYTEDKKEQNTLDDLSKGQIIK
jgi:flagellar biosynthesis chaperone FliJ